MPDDLLLTTYALAVQELLNALEALLVEQTADSGVRCARAAAEVKALTRLHLLPPIPPFPLPAEGGAL